MPVALETIRFSFYIARIAITIVIAVTESGINLEFRIENGADGASSAIEIGMATVDPAVRADNQLRGAAHYHPTFLPAA